MIGLSMAFLEPCLVVLSRRCREASGTWLRPSEPWPGMVVPCETHAAPEAQTWQHSARTLSARTWTRASGARRDEDMWNRVEDGPATACWARALSSSGGTDTLREDIERHV
ncbi:unnamed protein product, partial [Prorocentrum cordatum]